MIEKKAEPIKLKEMFSTANERVALQTRLILGGEALSSNKISLGKIKPEELTTVKQETIDKINHASTKERSDYWQNKGGFDQQLKSWCDSMVKYQNNPDFTEKEALETYHHYFGEKKGRSNINIYLDEIIAGHTQNGTINFDQLSQDLPGIKKMAHIFGGNSSEIIEDLILARAKLTDPAKKQKLIEQANEEKSINDSPILRLNWLNPEEDRLLKWLNQDEFPTQVVVPENLTTELAKKNPELFKTNLFNHLKNTNPRLYGVWEFALQKGLVSLENLNINPDTWMSESDSKDGIVLGTSPMSKGAKYKIIFDDAKFDYSDEVTYRLTHELSHKLLYFLTEQLNQKSEFNYLISTLIDLNTQKGKVVSSLASQELYRQKGAQIQGQEDLTELINMYLQSPDYLRRYLDFLTDKNYADLRQKYGLVNLNTDTANVLYEQLERGLKPLFSVMKPPEPKPRTEPIRVTPEQNLRVAKIFCDNLRQQLKNGSMERSGSNYRFTDPISKIHIEASNKDAVDTAWFMSAELESYAEKNQLPFVMLVKGSNHFNLLLKGPEQQSDGKYRIIVYDPFHNAPEYVEVPITENFISFSNRKLSEMKKLYNPSTKRYEFPNGSWTPEDRINHYLFTQWFKSPPNMDISYNNRVGWEQLVSGEYNLSLLEDSELPEELKFGKTQQFQFDGYNCGPLCLYTSILSYAAKPGQEQEKQRLVEQFANDFGIRILTRKELLGK